MHFEVIVVFLGPFRGRKAKNAWKSALQALENPKNVPQKNFRPWSILWKKNLHCAIKIRWDNFKKFWDSFLSSHGSFFFHKMFQRCLLISTSFTKEKVFSCVMQVVLSFPKQQPFTKQVGTVLRTEAKMFLQVCLERRSGRRKKKKFFLQNHDPRHSSKKTAEVVFVLEPD